MVISYTDRRDKSGIWQKNAAIFVVVIVENYSEKKKTFISDYVIFFSSLFCRIFTNIQIRFFEYNINIYKLFKDYK
jgi:hypothetical protein